MRRWLIVLSFVLCFGLAYGDPPKKTYGSGTSPKPSQTKSDPPKKTYGSGTSPKPSDASKPKSDNKGKSYGSGSDTKPSNPSTGEKPKSSSYDSDAGRSQKRIESKERFEKGKQPAPTYTDSKGKTHNIDPKDKKIEKLRDQLSEEKWKNRELRQKNFYQNYYSRPVIVYHDPYSSFFWWWLLDRSINDQAMWAYHHRYDMDSARYNDLLARNAELAARVRTLEAQDLPRNSTYSPTGMQDSDLMYNDNYVQAAYNPAPTVHHSEPGDSSFQEFILIAFVILAMIGIASWLIFIKRW